MQVYHRFTNSNSPMSSWGHAMLVNNESSQHYGQNHYTFTPNTDTKNILDLKSLIIAAWDNCKEDEDFGDLMDNYYISLDSEDVFDSFNPSDIVDSAQGWDCELMVWFWQFIAEPNGIMSIITDNGAIVWDDTLIKLTNSND